MIIGTHALIYSTNAEAIRTSSATYSNCLPSALATAGSSSLPPAELGIHPIENGNRSEIYFMSDNISFQRSRS